MATAVLGRSGVAGMEHVPHAVWAECILPLVGEKELWTLRLSSRYLYHDAGAALAARAKKQWGEGGDMQAMLLLRSLGTDEMNNVEAKRFFAIGDSDPAGVGVRVEHHRSYFR